MKLKLYTVAACLLLTHCAWAQNDSLRKAVENYRGRSNILLPNARQMMIDKLDSGLVEDVRVLTKFLMDEFKGSDMQLFYNRERVLLSYYTGDVRPLLAYFAGGKSYTEGGQLFRESHSYYSRYSPWLNDQLERVLFERTGREFNNLCAGVQAMPGLAADEKDVLQLYLRYLLPVSAGPAFTNDSVAYYGQQFLKAYPKSASAGFVHNVLLAAVKPVRNHLGLGINLGGGFINRTLMGQFNNQFSMGFEVHLVSRKYLVSGQVRVGGNRLAKDVNVNNTVWEKGKEATAISGAILAGKPLVKNKRFFIAPQIGVGFTCFKPVEEDIEQNPALKTATIQSAGVYPVVALLALRKSKDQSDLYTNDDFFFSGLRLNYEWHTYKGVTPGLKGGVFAASFTFGMVASYRNNYREYIW